MVWLAAACGVVLLAAGDAWTLRAVGRLSSPSPWRIAALGLLVSGTALGLWIGGALTYQVAPDLRYTGFPVPALVLHLENGRWVDYVGLIPVVVPFNVFIVASCCLSPVSFALLIRRLLAGSSLRPSDG